MSADARATRDTRDAPPRDMAPPAPAGWSARGVECGRRVSSDKSFLRFCWQVQDKPRKIICGAQYSPGFEPGRAHRRCYNFSFSNSVQSSIQSRLEHTRVPESYRKGLVAQWIRRGSTEPEIPGSIPGKINLLFFNALTRSIYASWSQLRPGEVACHSVQCGGVGALAKRRHAMLPKTFLATTSALILVRSFRPCYYFLIQFVFVWLITHRFFFPSKTHGHSEVLTGLQK